MFRLRHAYGTERIYHEALSEMWPGSISFHFHSDSCISEKKRFTTFGNQPWPYPSGLMVGFIADYAGGEINLQDEELSSGDFYTRDNLPELPRKLSLARKMIDWWIEHPNE